MLKLSRVKFYRKIQSKNDTCMRRDHSRASCTYFSLVKLCRTSVTKPSSLCKPEVSLLWCSLVQAFPHTVMHSQTWLYSSPREQKGTGAPGADQHPESQPLFPEASSPTRHTDSLSPEGMLAQGFSPLPNRLGHRNTVIWC